MPAVESILSAARSLRLQQVKAAFTTLGRYGAIQLLTQGVGALTGILIVRDLPIDGYAMYTLALSVNTAASMAMDSGVISAVSAIGGKVHTDPVRLGRLVASTLKVRRVLETFGLLAAAPLLGWRLAHAGADKTTILLVMAISATFIHSRVSLDIFEQVLRLELRSEEALRIEAKSMTLRMLLAGGVALIWHSFALVLLASLVAMRFQLRQLRPRVFLHLDAKALPDEVFTKSLWSSYATQAASTFYMIFSSQATVLVLSFFGGNTALASIGALSRLSVLFTICSVVITNFAYPRISRARNGEELRNRLGLLLGVATLTAVVVCGLVSIDPGLVLWVLGPRYSHLGPEVRLYFATSTLGMLTYMIWGVDAARGWIRGNWIVIPTSIAAQVAAMLLVDIGTVRGAVLVGGASLVPQFLVSVGLMLRGLGGKGIFEHVEATAGPPVIGSEGPER
jgi:O-antigen/teichoic acid export membrane protein